MYCVYSYLLSVQIRLTALAILNTSHSPGFDKATHFSLQDLSRMLGFVDKEQVSGCGCKGVITSGCGLLSGCSVLYQSWIARE